MMPGTKREIEIERAAGESFVVGDAVEVMVVGVSGNRVRFRCWVPGVLGLSPKELYEEIAEENRKAAESRLPTLEDLCLAQDRE